MASSEQQRALRKIPAQSRGERTRQKILDAAAELLEEIGIEDVTTNLICKQAGVTPPALYRYFSNKHAVLAALGERLMSKQNAIIEEFTFSPEARQTELEALLLRTVEVTRAEPGGVWITRALRASPVLADIRANSHQVVANLMVEQLGQTKSKLFKRRARLSVELGYAFIEMALESGDKDIKANARDTAQALINLLFDD